MKAILFDIDGTLLWTDGAGRRAIHHALLEVFGTTGPEDYWFDGKTDPQITRELMVLAGHDEAYVEARLERLLTRYVERLELELRDPAHVVKVYPGVPTLLDAIDARDDALLGLLTGNVVEGARAKLTAAGIDPERFVVGAFGSDHGHRPELPGIARQRILDELGHRLHGEDIVIIGDTPSDIECGRSLGVRAIGVATGRYRVADLAQHAPHAVFEDLSDTTAVLRAIFD